MGYGKLALWLGLVGVACGSGDTPRAAERDAPREASVPDAGTSTSTSMPTPDASVRDDDAGDGAAQGDAGPGAQRALTITFVAKVGSEPFGCDRTYQNFGSTNAQVQPVDLRMFVQNMALIRKRDRAETAIELDVREPYQRAEVALLDFEDNQGSCVRVGGSEGTNTIVTGSVPAGEYDGIAFSNGVPASVNHENPIDLTPPLTAGPLHWNWNNGFIFFDAQVKELLDTSDAGDTPGSALVHIGSTLCAPSGCGKSNRNRIVLENFDPDVNRIVIDVGAIFRNVDVRKVTTCHAVGTGCTGFMGPLGIELETGEAAPTQTIYRVE